METPTATSSPTESDLERRILAILTPYVGTLIARSIVGCVKSDTGLDIGTLRVHDMPKFKQELEKGVNTFVRDPARRKECWLLLADELCEDGQGIIEQVDSGTVQIQGEYDIVTARGEARHMCEQVGFPAPSQIKVATVVSELARNIVQYAGRGVISFNVLSDPLPGIEIIATDDGPGISNLDSILAGQYESQTGMGMGLFGTRNLMDEFEVETNSANGTRVITRKYLK